MADVLHIELHSEKDGEGCLASDPSSRCILGQFTVQFHEYVFSLCRDLRFYNMQQIEPRLTHTDCQTKKVCLF